MLATPGQGSILTAPSRGRDTSQGAPEVPLEFLSFLYPSSTAVDSVPRDSKRGRPISGLRKRRSRLGIAVRSPGAESEAGRRSRAGRHRILCVTVVRTRLVTLPGAHDGRACQGSAQMQTSTHEIASRVYRISTCAPEGAPGGFAFNQFFVVADDPLLVQTGPRRMFPLVSMAIARIVPVERLRWIPFVHVESDECGAMNEFLAAAPHAQVAHGAIGCMVSLDDLCDRPPRKLTDGEVIDLGGKRVPHIDTPRCSRPLPRRRLGVARRSSRRCSHSCMAHRRGTGAARPSCASPMHTN